MVIGMISDDMSLPDDAGDKVGVFFGPAADDKKRRFHFVFGQDAKHLRRKPGIRDVVEREGDLLDAGAVDFERIRIFFDQLSQGQRLVLLSFFRSAGCARFLGGMGGRGFCQFCRLKAGVWAKEADQKQPQTGFAEIGVSHNGHRLLSAVCS